MVKLCILIPTLTSRAKLLARLMAELDRQRAGKDVIIIQHEDQGQKTTGQKRNELVQVAVEHEAEYISFVDDDDMVGPTYIQRGIDVAESGMDCGELWGQIYFKGKPGNPFHHSIIHKTLYQDKQFYFRPPNHLNFIRLDTVKDIKFQEKNFGEDSVWAMDIVEAGVLKSQYPIKETIYHYFK